MSERVGRSPPPQEGEEAETTSMFAPIVQNLGVFTGGSQGSTTTVGFLGSSAPCAAGDPCGCQVRTVALPCTEATH